MQKIGIFGGSFNPPHNGHLNIATQLKNELKLNKMLIMPTGTSPHKTKSAISFDDRTEMCRLAFPEQNGFEICDIEGGIKGRSYTVNSLMLIKKRYPENTRFYLIIGADMLFMFKEWYKYETILKECEVVAAARKNDQYTDMIECAAEIGRIKVLNLAVKEVSSSEVREKLADNKNAEDLVPGQVLDYIERKRLYVK